MAAITSRDDLEVQIQRDVTNRALAARRRDRLERWLLPCSLVVGLLAIWELIGRTIGFNPLFFSYPSQIAKALYYYADNGLWSDLRISGLEWLLGLAIALVGVPLGMLIGASRRMVYMLDPIIDALYATPIVAMTPLLIIWFGLGLESKVVVVAVLAFFPLVIMTIQGMSTVEGQLVDAARSLGGRRLNLYLDVIGPGITPFIVSGLRLAIRSAVIGVVLGEFIGGLGGVGYRIRVYASAFQTARYLAAVVVLVAFAVGANFLLKIAEKRLAPWREGLGR